MKRKIIFNVGEKMTRVAILEGQELAELFIEKNDNANAVGNIYKGVIEEVIPGLQAVFVNIGAGKNAFLHFNDVDVEPYLAEALRERQSIRRRSRSRPREGAAPDQGYYIRIEDCLTRGREIMVQMTKEPISTKGARVSANLALAGRYLVLMPGSEGKGGVSKKVEDMAERRRLKKILAQIDVPDCSFIIRTAGIGRSAAEIYADVDNLLDRWDDIQQKFRRSKAPALIYSEQDCFSRIVRDNFPEDVDEIVIDHAPSRDKLVAALEENLPELAGLVKLHSEPRNVFEKHRVEKAIFTALQRKVPLKSGGYLIFDECEALTVIDINSGSFIGGREQEKMIQRINTEACEEIARQLRLRDIGGLIVIDFIDMATKEGQRRVAERLREELHKDRTRVSIGRFSDFGILELTRKRVRNSLRNTLTKACPYCGGSGRIAIESVVWKQIRYDLLAQLAKHRAGSYEIIVHPHVSDYITEHLTPLLAAWEKEYAARIDVRVQKSYHFETYSILRNGKVLCESGLDKIESFHDVEYIAPSAPTIVMPALAEGDEEEEAPRASRRRPERGARGDRDVRPAEGRGAGDDDLPPSRAEEEDEEDVRPIAPAAPRAVAEEEGNGRVPRRGRSRGGRERVLEQRDARDESAEEREAYRSLPERDEAEADEAPRPRREERRDEQRPRDRREERRPESPRAPQAHDAEESAKPAPKAAATTAPDSRPRVPNTSAPGLYGDLVGVVPVRRKVKRVRFDHNQVPLAHYGETAMGQRPGAGLPAKVARPAHETVTIDSSKVEASLLVREYQRVASAQPAGEPGTSGRRHRAPRPEAAPQAPVAEATPPEVADVVAEARPRAAGRAPEQKTLASEEKQATRRRRGSRPAAAEAPAEEPAPVEAHAPEPQPAAAPSKGRRAPRAAAKPAASRAEKAPAPAKGRAAGAATAKRTSGATRSGAARGGRKAETAGAASPRKEGSATRRGGRGRGGSKPSA